jgi:hypothetical protein
MPAPRETNVIPLLREKSGGEITRIIEKRRRLKLDCWPLKFSADVNQERSIPERSKEL